MHLSPCCESGTDICARLQTHVERRLGGRVRHFHLEVLAEGVVLRGYARSYYVKQLAQHAVMDASDVPILANEIEVF